MKALIYRSLLATFLFINTITFSQIDTSYVYRITNVWQGDGKSLDVTADEGKNVRPALAPNHEFPNQQWRISKDKYGNFMLSNYRLGSTKQLECLAGETNNKLILGDKKNVASQAWKITKNTDGSYRITSLWQGTGKALDVVNDGNNNELQMANTGNVSGQMWRFTKLFQIDRKKPATPTVSASFNDTTLSYRLTTVWQGESKPLSSKGNSLLLMPSSQESNQYWQLVPANNGYYRIVNRKEKNKSLDVINDGKANNQLTLSPSANYSGQFWKIVAVGNDTYRLTSMWQGDGKSLDVLNDGKNNNQVILNATGDYSGQMWKITKQGLPSAQSIKEGLPTTPEVKTGAIAPPSKEEVVKYEIYAGQELERNYRYYSQDKRYYLVLQDDSNLVLYNADGKPRWASNTNGRNVKNCIMQTDGNLVMYNEDDNAVWATGTDGNPGAYLLVADDGDLMIFTRQYKRLWHSDTSDGGK